jgi:glycosyltransferase involved in cell wall biosynthesis
MWAFTGGCHYALDCEGYRLECGECPYLKRPGPADLSHRIWKKKEKILKNSSITVVTPSEWLNECVTSSSLLGHCEVHTIYNPIDQTRFRPVEKSTACRNLGLDPDKKYILFGAATIHNMLKGFDHFVEAIRMLSGEMVADGNGDQDVEILLFGKSKGDMASYFPLKVHSIAQTESSGTIVDIYSAAHLFVIPSLQDNLPNTIVESMLCGTPVVGFRSGGIPEMIDHKQNGYLAEYKSTEDLAVGINWILTSGDYQQLSAEARSTAVKRFSRERSTEQYVKLYHTILGTS